MGKDLYGLRASRKDALCLRDRKRAKPRHEHALSCRELAFFKSITKAPAKLDISVILSILMQLAQNEIYQAHKALSQLGNAAVNMMLETIGSVTSYPAKMQSAIKELQSICKSMDRVKLGKLLILIGSGCITIAEGHAANEFYLGMVGKKSDDPLIKIVTKTGTQEKCTKKMIEKYHNLVKQLQLPVKQIPWGTNDSFHCSTFWDDFFGINWFDGFKISMKIDPRGPEVDVLNEVYSKLINGICGCAKEDSDSFAYVALIAFGVALLVGGSLCVASHCCSRYRDWSGTGYRAV